MQATFNEAMPTIYTAAVAEQQEAITTKISQNLNQEMLAFQEQSLSSHQTQLRDGLTNIFQSVNNQAKTDLRQQMELIQAEALNQMRDSINEAIPTIYTAAAEEIKAKFAEDMLMQSKQVKDNFLSMVNADLPAVQEVMRDNIQQVLATTLPTLENDLRKQLTVELHDLLQKVKFVLPK
jgi:pheromone shutdown protein TraB